MRGLSIYLLLCFSVVASAGEFRKYETQPRADLVNCETAGVQTAIEGQRGSSARVCETVVVGGMRFYLAVVDRLVEEGSSPKRVRTYDIFTSHNETSKLVVLRSETVDVIDAAGDPSRRGLMGGVQLTWGQSALNKRAMVQVAKRSPIGRDTFILKLNDAGDWLENTFEELETK